MQVRPRNSKRKIYIVFLVDNDVERGQHTRRFTLSTYYKKAYKQVGIAVSVILASSHLLL